jgi:hypothetical protein
MLLRRLPRGCILMASLSSLVVVLRSHAVASGTEDPMSAAATAACTGGLTLCFPQRRGTEGLMRCLYAGACASGADEVRARLDSVPGFVTSSRSRDHPGLLLALHVTLIRLVDRELKGDIGWLSCPSHLPFRYLSSLSSFSFIKSWKWLIHTKYSRTR